MAAINRVGPIPRRDQIIASGKPTYKATSGGTGDDWNVYTTERNELIDYIVSAQVTGCVWMCGDPHGAFVAYDAANTNVLGRFVSLQLTRSW